MTVALETKPQTQTEPKLKPFDCKCCGRQLGMNNQHALFVGAVIIKRALVVHCGDCGQPRRWKPCTYLL